MLGPPKFGRIESTKVDKPWGYELRWAITGRYLGKVLHINKGEALSLQFHERKNEYQYVLRGAIDIELGAGNGKLTAHRMEAGDTLHIITGTRHRPHRRGGHRHPLPRSTMSSVWKIAMGVPVI